MMLDGGVLVARVAGAFRYVSRPKDVEHRHPVLVFDREERLHLPLTVYARKVLSAGSAGTGRAYLNAVLPFFTYLETDSWQVRSGRTWDGPPDVVRQAVYDYLVQTMKCRVRQHRLRFQVVAITAGTKSTVRVFLSALKLFYRVMSGDGRYAHENPMVDLWSLAAESDPDGDRMPPRMPDISGVEEPRRTQRLSDSYFKMEGGEWIPQVVDDPTLPSRVLRGGRALKNWGLREECITRILFESGGRISEVVGLTLGDWLARGGQQEASAFSKGSNGVRVKFLRFSADTAKLLQRYCDTERRQRDPDQLILAQHAARGKQRMVDLTTVPLFLSIRGTALTPKTFRDHYWTTACEAAGIDADVHQARHWYVTMVVRHIYETAKTDGEVKRRLRELIEYMKWRRGWETIEAYEHYFDAARHAEIQDGLHAKMDQALKLQLEERKRRPARPGAPQTVTPAPMAADDDPDFDFLRSIGGGTAVGNKQ